MKPVLTRRAFLHGTSCTLALPFLESALPRNVWGAKHAPPRRLAFCYVPNGIHMPAWTPAEEGDAFAMPFLLEPLEPFRDRLLVLSGLTQDKARANGDGPGDHARSAAAWLTGVQPYKTAGADIRGGLSVDQLAAQRLGSATRLRSLELGCEATRTAGSCDSGYACAYSSTISWASPYTPVVHEIDPARVFDRLYFGGRDPQAQERFRERARTRRSVLDFVQGEARELRTRLGTRDRRKLDEYQEAVRELERRIEFAVGASRGEESIGRPEGVPKAYAEHLDLLFDLMALAFRTDTTRIATFMLANEGSNRSYRDVGVRSGHHELSHHAGDAEKQASIQRINRFHMEHFARFIGQLASFDEDESSVLDASMIVYGSCIGDGNRHNHHDLPMLLVGGGGGTLRGGRHLRWPKDTPANNLYQSLLDRLGVSVPELGDSNGRLEEIGVG